MICPHCNQEHPDGTEICPETGKALGNHVTAGSNPEVQAPTLAQSETIPQAGLITHSAGTAEPVMGTKTPQKRHTVAWVIGGCAAIPIIVLLLLALVIILDPFKLHVLGRITGRYDAAAEVMPADTGVYMGINIGNGILTHIDRVLAPFMPTDQGSSSLGYLRAPADPRSKQQAGPFDNLLLQIEEETGIKIPDDISPWVGQYAGAGVVEFDTTSFGQSTPTGWMIAIEARNLFKADSFLEKLQQNMTELHDIKFTHQPYRGVDIIVEDKNGSPTGIAFGRHGRMVTVASSLDILKKAIDRPAGQALSAATDYTSLIKVRPFDWTASFYFNHAWIGNLLEQYMGSNASPTMQLINPNAALNWTGMLMNVAAIKQGARVDMYVDFDETQSAANSGQLQNINNTPLQVIQVLPQETVAFIANNNFELMTQGLLTASYPSESDLNRFLDSINTELGFSLRNDLLDQLTGEWALYAVPSTHGYLPNQANLDIAVSLLVQIEGKLDLKPILDGLNQAGIGSGIKVAQQERDGITYYELSVFGSNDPILGFGTGNGYFTLGTDSDKLRLSSPISNSIANSDNYQTATSALPGQMTPSLYVDLENLFANLREGMDAAARESFNESISAVAPIRVIASGTRLLNEGVAHSSIVIILVDK